MKNIKRAFLLTIGVCLTSLLFAQTPASGSVPAKPVANSAVNTPASSAVKPVPAATSSKKVKAVDKKKRKPSQVTAVKKKSTSAPKNLK